MKKTIWTVVTTAVLLAAFWITGTMGVVTNKIIAYRESSTPFTVPQTFSGGFKRPSINLKEVCPSGCEFSTVQSAIDAITDASATKRYTVLIYPGNYDEDIIATSYITFVGTDREASRLRGLASTVPPGTVRVGNTAVEVGFSHLTIGGYTPIYFDGTQPATPITTYITDCNLGIIDGTEGASGKSVDGYLDNSGNRRVYQSGVICRTTYDCVRIARNTIHYGSGNTYIHDTKGLDPSQIRTWSFTGAGAQVYESGAVVTMLSDSATTLVQPIDLSGMFATTPTQKTIFSLSGAYIHVETTNTSKSVETNPIILGTVAANSLGGLILLNGVYLDVLMADSTTTLNALKVANADADHAPWAIDWTSGGITMSGGATRNDINTVETNASFFIKMNGVKHSGVYTGSGTAQIVAGDSRIGAFTTKLTGPCRDLAVGACTLGETACDTGGATKEYCACGTANTWGCWNLATGAFNANGPAD